MVDYGGTNATVPVRVYMFWEGWVILRVIGVDDMIDGGPRGYNISIQPNSVFLYNTSTSVQNVTYIKTKSYRIPSFTLDNDTAGLAVTQSGHTSYR